MEGEAQTEEPDDGYEILLVVPPGTRNPPRGYIIQKRTAPGVFPVYLKRLKRGEAVVASSEPTVFPEKASAERARELYQQSR